MLTNFSINPIDLRCHNQSKHGKHPFLLSELIKEYKIRLSLFTYKFNNMADIGWYTKDTSKAARSLNIAKSIKVINLNDQLSSISKFHLSHDINQCLMLKQLNYLQKPLNLLTIILSLNYHPQQIKKIFLTAHSKLEPNGLFLGCLIGESTLSSLRKALIQAESEIKSGASLRIPPLPTIQNIGQLLQTCNFKLPVCDIENYTKHYKDIISMMEDVRVFGGSYMSHLKRAPLSKRILNRATEIYQNKTDSGQLIVDYELIWFTGWAPHESQQKPLIPGTGKIELKEVLK